MYFKKVGEIFARNALSNGIIRSAQLMSQIAYIIGRIFRIVSMTQSFINKRLLPLVSEKQLPELPQTWLITRLHPIIEQREQTPTSRIDLLQLMMQVMTKEVINVSKIYQT